MVASSEKTSRLEQKPAVGVLLKSLFKAMFSEVCPIVDSNLSPGHLVWPNSRDVDFKSKQIGLKIPVSVLERANQVIK